MLNSWSRANPAPSRAQVTLVNQFVTRIILQAQSWCSCQDHCHTPSDTGGSKPADGIARFPLGVATQAPRGLYALCLLFYPEAIRGANRRASG